MGEADVKGMDGQGFTGPAPTPTGSIPNPWKLPGRYTITLHKDHLHWIARVVTIGIGKPERCPTFRARSRNRALDKAKRWCDRRHAERAERVEYQPPPINHGAHQ